MRLLIRNKSYHYGNRTLFKIYKVPKLVAVGKEAKGSTFSKNYNSSKQKSSVSRSRINLERLIVHNINLSRLCALVTYTFRDKVFDLSEAKNFFRLYLKRLFYSEHFAENDKHYICIAEFQKNGRVHFHVLHFGRRWYDLADTERKSRFIAKFWGYGFVDMVPINDISETFV